MKAKSRFTVKRLAMDGLLVAMTLVVAMLKIQIGGLKLTFEALPTILCAVIFGPVDAMIVGGLGELLDQLTSFGLTPTTVLWILPAVSRGLFVGLCVKAMNKRLSADTLTKTKHSVLFVIVCIISAIIVSCINTVALYVDSKMFGYYSYAMVFGVFGVRIITGVISSAIMAIAAIPIVAALKKTKFI